MKPCSKSLGDAGVRLYFWRTDACYHRGCLPGTGLALYGARRFLLEFTRPPDAGLEHLSWGLTTGQRLSGPMIAAGA